MKKSINKISKEIYEKRTQILDDFSKAYTAIIDNNYFEKKGKIETGKLELVEWKKSPTETIYSFKLKKGKMKEKQKKSFTTTILNYEFKL